MSNTRGLIRKAVAAAALTAAVPLAVVSASEPAAAASCEFPTYQYVVTGQSVSLWTQPEGQVKAVLQPGDLVNSGIRPDGGGWLIGNAYTSSRQHIDDGWVLRHWTAYTGTSWC